MSLFESSSKGVKFETIGASVTGTITSAPRERQQTKYGTQEPDFWPNGDPKMQILVDLQTSERVDASDDGERTLYVASKNLKRAIGEAIRNASAPDLMPGGVLTVSYIGNDPASKNPANPAKLYSAQYSAPTSGFVAAAAATPTTPAPPFAAPAPAPVVPAPGGLTPEQVAQLTQLRAASIPEGTIATAIGATPQQIAVYDSTPF